MNFCVVGAGAWGTAFAIHLARLGRPVVLVPRRPEQAAALKATRENLDYLPGVTLPPGVVVTGNLSDGLAGADVVLLACPSQAMRATCERIREALPAFAKAPEGEPRGGPPALVLSLAKGLELGTHLRPSQLIAEILAGSLAGALTGPTNAAEVARGLPGAMVLATPRLETVVTSAQAAMSGSTLRLYTSDDLVGVEYGGCLKNIYAIAAGCCDGLKLGDNARSALLTRALAEMVRVGAALGARPETFYGLSGFGDLVATCHGGWSRNREFGQQLGEGHPAAELIANRRTVVEGHATTQSFAGLCEEQKIDAPILREVNAILFAGKKPSAALSALMNRELKRETLIPMAKA